MLVTLDYHGQEIDLGGAFETKIYDQKKDKRIPFPVRLKTARILRVYGIEVSVVAPEDLLAYKKLLGGRHQWKDIGAIEKYIERNSIYTQ